MKIKHCTACGSLTIKQVPEDDEIARDICCQCGVVHYQNPILIVGCVPELDGQILLCKRNIEPRKGLWTLPAGYLENGETVEQGAARETLEESQAKVEIIKPYRMYNIVYVNQIYLIFRANMKSNAYGPTAESMDVRLFGKKDIPWNKIAFPVIKETLEDFYIDRDKNTFSFKIKDIKTRLHEK
jgi:ADP-ribose pyrophosphatase YjhB (NUDIX family)